MSVLHFQVPGENQTGLLRHLVQLPQHLARIRLRGCVGSLLQFGESVWAPRKDAVFGVNIKKCEKFREFSGILENFYEYRNSRGITKNRNLSIEWTELDK